MYNSKVIGGFFEAKCLLQVSLTTQVIMLSTRRRRLRPRHDPQRVHDNLRVSETIMH